MEVLKIKTKSNGKDTKDKIIELFFTEHLRLVDISKKLKVGMPYITKIIQKDSRYIEEKEARKLESKEKNKVQKRMYAQNKRQKEKQEKQEYQKLLVQINRDNEYLSTKKKENDLQFANWNRSAYEYDKDSSDLVLKDNLNTGFNVAKRDSNIVNSNTIKSNKIYV
jgi:adenine-specific DNA glycosylase